MQALRLLREGDDASPGLSLRRGVRSVGVPATPEDVHDLDDTELRVWLDDDLVDRRAPTGWVQATTAREAIELIDSGRVVELSLDHDLGDDEANGRGVEVVDHIAERQVRDGVVLWPRDGITLHTANPSGRDAMRRTILRYAPEVVEVSEGLTAGGHRAFRFGFASTTEGK